MHRVLLGTALLSNHTVSRGAGALCGDVRWEWDKELKRSNHWKQGAGTQRSRYRMVLDTLNAASVFGGNAQRLALALRTNDAPKMDHTVRDDDIRFVQNFRPFLLAQLGKQPAPDRLVPVLVRHIGCAARQYSYKIGSADNPDQLAVMDHWYALYPVSFHQIGDLAQGCQLVDCDDVGGVIMSATRRACDLT